MDIHKLREEIRSFVLENFLPDEDSASLTDSTPLIATGILDSINTVRLISHLEQQYGIKLDLPTLDTAQLNTIPGICQLIATGKKPR